MKNLKTSDEIIQKINNNITWDEFIKLKSELEINSPYFIFPATDYEGFICVFMEQLLSLRKNYFEVEVLTLILLKRKKFAVIRLTWLINTKLHRNSN